MESKATKDAVYINYIGLYYIDISYDERNMYPVHILKFSIDGKPLADFDMGTNMSSFYIDEDNNKIYCDSPKNNIYIFNF